MHAFSLKYNLKRIDSRHGWAINKSHFPDFQQRCAMHAKYCTHIIDNACFYNFQSPAGSFFSRLKNDANGAIDFLFPLLQQICRSQDSGNMKIMAAGMHAACMFGPIGYVSFFRNRQRIYVATNGRNRMAAGSKFCY